ncbi:MlaD family protein [Candidatus Albibeggiatoa sp. nov. NOAA]|uniref:MlaD family protein n=1 Tax=Candidatus Albibeggiatoa sp. nov. NOAA TaxID=3162724 RepID=UPI0032FBD2A6|nr:MCE family protein [Thiotrichaceae bacterium]
MNNKANYILVGLFVMILSFVFIASVLWLTLDKDNKTYGTYQVYINESVSGLNLKAPVKYKGVQVGSVQDIRLNPARPDAVYLLLKIEQNTPIKQDTYAMLSVNGLTGVAFIELAGGSLHAPEIQLQPDQPYPEIASKPSLFQRVDTAVNQFFSQQNSDSIAQSLKNIQTVTNTFAKHEQNIDQFLHNITETSYHTAQLSKDLSAMTQQVADTLQATQNTADSLNQLLQTNQDNIQHSTASIAEITDELHVLSRNLRNDMDFLGQQAAPAIVNNLTELQHLLRTARRLIHTLELKPNMLLFGNAKPDEGPGE